MNQRNDDHLQAVLDYFFHLDSGGQREATERLLGEDARARDLLNGLKRMLTPLDCMEEVDVPQGLAERTVAFVERFTLSGEGTQDDAARSGRSGNGRESRWMLANFSDTIAIAASILLIMVFLPQGLNYARHRTHQIACAGQLGQIGKAFDSYAADYNGYLPFVPRPGEQRWCDVGKPGSNTRNIFLLVNRGYVPFQAFTCPAVPMQMDVRVHYDASERKTMVDFRRRYDISYSSRLMTQQNHTRLNKHPQELLMADQNPLFMDLEYRRELDLYHAPYLMEINSPNHRGVGQNTLRADGAVNFLTSRRAGIFEDDIFTIQSVTRYRGTETPEAPGDIFIAP